MARLPFATRDDIAPDQREVFDEIVAALGGKPPQHGPGSVMIYAPEARRWEQGLNHYLRGESALSKKVQELAILVVAREMDCPYIWNSHAAVARKAGVSDAIITALRERKRLPPLAAADAAVIHFGQEFFQTHKVSAATFQKALKHFGRRALVELSLMFGSYSMLVVVANAFEIDLPANASEPLLPTPKVTSPKRASRRPAPPKGRRTGRRLR